MTDKKLTVYGVTAQLLSRLDQSRSAPSTRAALANIRGTVGRPIDQAFSVWPILFESMPEEFLSKYKEPSYQEMAILTTLQLYALHQQGKADSVLELEDEYWNNIGTSLKSLRVGDDQESMDRRFNVLITSSTFEELSHHLRQMIKLLRSKSKTKVNYPRLAEDLYWFLRGDSNGIKLRWSREYYKININKGEDDNE